MDTLMLLLDFILHVDRHLREFVDANGSWVYALLFLIIFVETGLVVMPFLPGDSLLFVVGTLCGTGAMDIGTSLAVMFGAAVAGIMEMSPYLPNVSGWFGGVSNALRAEAVPDPSNPALLVIGALVAGVTFLALAVAAQER